MTLILAYRFSAFGDVAMTVPVIKEFLEQNPEVEIVMASRKMFKDLFNDIPRLIFLGVDFNEYKGLTGLRKLHKEIISQYKIDFVADLHDIIRTKILNFFFKASGIKVSRINKERAEKKILTDTKNLNKKALKKNTERYADVFRNLGFKVTLSHRLKSNVQEKKGIGFAPFAQHKGKMLPLEKSYELARILSKKYKIYFFGGGKEETSILKKWEEQLPNTQCLAGTLSLNEELEKIAHLEAMISMDSANMHLASIVGTRCLSIWMQTHPYAGFLGYGQNENDTIQINDFTCRPCSVFGNKECYRGDWSCRDYIDVQKIIDKL